MPGVTLLIMVEMGQPQDLDPDIVVAAAEEQRKQKMLPAHPPRNENSR